MYRDANNYKVHSKECVFKGNLSPKEISDILNTYGEGDLEGFIPSQIGLTDLQSELQAYDSEDYGDDVCVHEVSSVENSDSDPNQKMTAKEFYTAIMSTKWEHFQVPHPRSKF
jgi:hypothetical protein